VPELVSILIPAFNAAATVGAAIRSALDQDWPRKEVIVVDDGSRDATLDVARRFRTSSVQVLTQPNRGASAARNRALAEAQGDYIQWLDADDLLAADKISCQLRNAEPGATSRELIAGPFGEFIVRPEAATFRPTPLWQDLEPAEFLLRKFTHNVYLANNAWLVSRRLTELAGPWDERLSLDDDGEYFARVLSRAGWVRFVRPARAYYRRSNAGSLSRAVSKPARRSALLALGLAMGYLRGLEDSERTRSACLRFLQTCVDRGNCFYPGHGGALDDVDALAREVGGRIRPPSLDWKYRPVRMLFGWPGVRTAKALVARGKAVSQARCQQLLSLMRPPTACTAAGQGGHVRSVSDAEQPWSGR
jgi:glycosyltransferase involved in cell wall biosynthesis